MLTWIKNHKIATIVIIVVLVLGGYYYTHQTKPEYTSYTVETGTIKDTLELSGKVSAEGMAVLRFPTGGLITYLGANEGDTVKKWQTLASIDSRQVQKTLEQKLNLYAIQRGTFEQTIDDNDNSVPDADLGRELKRLLAQNQYQLENTVKDVEYLDLSLKLTRLSSPLSGILVKSPIKTSGVNVLATDTWIVVDPTTLYFSADLDETELKRVKIGMPVEIKLDAYPDQTIKSAISSIAYAPKETTSGTVYEIKLAIDESDLESLRLGLNGSATVILLEKKDVLRLPSSALTFEGVKSSVYVKNGDDYDPKEIEIGIENDGFVEIIKGLSQNDQVYSPKTN
ncbi:MAG: efflux RND transporter periplasmic adaptor subunit [Candidatus Moraniibacteriota bacterium]|nr:MAG: efflux RND transporter periplasmic adaptor subunit [Candidatus Moranbacteria bacterium]